MHLTTLQVVLDIAHNFNPEQVLQSLINWGVEVGKDIIAAIIIYIIGRFIIKQILRIVKKIFEKKKTDISVQSFLMSVLSVLLYLVLAFAIISKLGVETTSLAALLASAGVAIGMALSGNLSNFAGGLLILIFKPFKIGDYIDAVGASGTVREIDIFHTVLLTVDNKVVYVPNGTLSSNTITNYSKEALRRVDFSFAVEYGEDFEKVKASLERIIAADSRILKEPAHFIAVGALSDSSVDITVRVWVKAADYWDVNFDMIKTVYATFNKEGIGFPFPQVTVHQA